MENMEGDTFVKLKLYETPGDFLRENEAFLRQYEAVCQLNIGNAQGFREDKCRPDLLFGRFEKNEEAVLLFGNTAPWNICLNAMPGDPKGPEAAAELAVWLKAEDIPIGGVTAAKELCDSFMPSYGRAFVEKSAMDIMVLEAVISPDPVPGRMRRAEQGDVEVLVGWHQNFLLEAVHEDHSLDESRQKVLRYLDQDALFLWEDGDGRPVSMAATARDMAWGVSISAVYTPPEERGRGYCQNCIAAVCREKLQSGKSYCTLFVDKKNPSSNRAYRKIGFSVLQNAYEYRLVGD